MSRLLYLDYDGPLNIAYMHRRIHNVANMVVIKLEFVEMHETRRGFHVIVNAEWPDHQDITPAEMVALQLLLGSDPKRESFNLLRAHRLGDAPNFWRDRWNVLYSEKL